MHRPMLTALLLALPHSDDPLVFAPAPETPILRTLVVETTERGGELSVWMNGGQVPSGFLPRIEFESTETVTLEVVDRFLAESDAAPTQLVRELRTVARATAGSFGMDGESEEFGGEGVSPLEGTTLLYDLGGDATEVRAVDPDTLEPTAAQLPACLVEDLDLRGLLPADDEPATGSRWDAEPHALAAVLHALGDAGFEPGEDEPARPVERRAWSGQLECTLEESEAGRHVIAVEGELTCRSHWTGDLSMVPVADGATSEQETLEFTLTGRLEWSDALGSAAAFELDATFESETETTKQAGQPGPDYRSLFVGEGSLELRLEAGLTAN